MTGRRSRSKGKRGELEAAKALNALGFRCRRGQQFSGVEGRDVVGIDGLHLECKRVEAFSLYPALEQAGRDAAEADVPVVLHRRSRKPWVVIVELENVVAFAHRVLAGVESWEDC